jgi:hypothetical protein
MFKKRSAIKRHYGFLQEALLAYILGRKNKLKPSSMDIQALTERCIDETKKYLKNLAREALSCFELMRLALAENNQMALSAIYRNYRQLIRSWVMLHPGFLPTQEPPEFFTLDAFSSFYFAVRGEKFANFPDLARLLAFLKACVHSSIMMYLRKQRIRIVPLPPDGNVIHLENFEGNLSYLAIWERICALLPSEEDQNLAYLAFVQERKAADIAKALPERYTDARAVSVALQRIRYTLKNDANLRDLLGAKGKKDIQTKE